MLFFNVSSATGALPNLLKIDSVVHARRRTHVGRRPIAIDHLSDSNNLKFSFPMFETLYTLIYYKNGVVQTLIINYILFFLYGFFRPNREFFTHFETSPYTQNSWLLCSKSFLTCHTYCDLGQPCIMVVSEVR